MDYFCSKSWLGVKKERSESCLIICKSVFVGFLVNFFRSHLVRLDQQWILTWSRFHGMDILLYSLETPILGEELILEVLQLWKL